MKRWAAVGVILIALAAYGSKVPEPNLRTKRTERYAFDFRWAQGEVAPMGLQGERRANEVRRLAEQRYLLELGEEERALNYKVP